MEHLHFNYKLMIKELQKRGVVCRQIGATAVVECLYGNHKEYLLESSNRLIPAHYMSILNDKICVKSLLYDAKLPIAPGIVITTHHLDEAIEQIEAALEYPICIKPPDRNHGFCVHPSIQCRDELRYVWKINPVLQSFPALIVEKHIYGDDLRIFIMEDEEPVFLKRVPPQIAGNGKDSLATLIQEENERRLNPRTSCTSDIFLDDPDGMRCIERQGLSLDSVIEKGRIVPLLFVSNVSYGGTCHRLTEGVHSDYLRLAQEAFSLFPGLVYLAVDLLVENIGQPYVPTNAVISELATYPGYSLFLLPSEGPPVDIVARIIDRLFPETKEPNRPLA
jgi:cyanophycin synthetase